MDADYASEELLLLLRPTPPLTTFSRDIALRTASLHAYAYAYAYATPSYLAFTSSTPLTAKLSESCKRKIASIRPSAPPTFLPAPDLLLTLLSLTQSI